MSGAEAGTGGAAAARGGSSATEVGGAAAAGEGSSAGAGGASASGGAGATIEVSIPSPPAGIVEEENEEESDAEALVRIREAMVQLERTNRVLVDSLVHVARPGGDGEPTFEVEEEAEVVVVEVEESSAAWINPYLLQFECKDCVCALCFGVMAVPTSGCPEGHCFCRACYGKALREQKKCPACRHPTDKRNLVRARPLEGIISQLQLRCEHAAGGEGVMAAGAHEENPAAAASPTVMKLRAELRQRGLDWTGSKPELAARLEEDRKKDAGCRWMGSVGELAAHLRGCGWPPVKCPNKGCTASPLRKDLPQHKATCEHRKVPCEHCKREMTSRSLAEHEGRCREAQIECPNEGCSEQHKRRAMDVHRAKCQHEGLACPCPGCEARVLRKDMDAHVEATHQDSWVKLLQSAWSRNAALERKVESELRLAAPSPTSWVFNWSADGWERGWTKSEPHAFGGGVSGSCVLQHAPRLENSHYLGLLIEGRAKRRVHATLSILDKHDKSLREIRELGTATAPFEIDFSDGLHKGVDFTPTAEEKAQSVRADGSIRLRAVVRLFLDGTA